MISLRKNILLRIFLVIIISATVAFIWSNSLENAKESSEMSNTVVEKVKPIVDPQDKIDDDLFVKIVRKAAHFSEFALLGCEMYLFISTFDRLKKKKLCPFIIPVGISFLVAITDECLQLTSEGRSCEFADMMIDLAGIVIGTAVAGLLCYIIKKILRKAG